MFLIKKNLIIVLTVLAVSLFSIGSARAFFPKDDEISASIHSSYARLNSYEAEISFPDYPGQIIKISSSHNRWHEDWSVKTDSNSTTASAVGLIFDVNRSCPENSQFPAPITSFWFPRDPIKDWMDLGVSNATKSYGFKDDTPSLIIGAEVGDDTSPQVWLDNENFALVKLIFKSKSGLVELDFDSYERFGGYDVPKSGKIIFDGNDPVVFDIKWLTINRNLDPSIFEEESVKNTPCALPEGELFNKFSNFLTPIN